MLPIFLRHIGQFLKDDAHLPQATTWSQGIKTVLSWSIKHILHSFDFSIGLSVLPSELFEPQL